MPFSGKLTWTKNLKLVLYCNLGSNWVTRKPRRTYTSRVQEKLRGANRAEGPEEKCRAYFKSESSLNRREGLGIKLCKGASRAMTKEKSLAKPLFFEFHLLLAVLVICLSINTQQPRRKWPGIFGFVFLLFWWVHSTVKTIALAFLLGLSIAYRILLGYEDHAKSRLAMVICLLSFCLVAFRTLELIGTGDFVAPHELLYLLMASTNTFNSSEKELNKWQAQE
eukprot:g41192.t1